MERREAIPSTAEACGFPCLWFMISYKIKNNKLEIQESDESVSEFKKRKLNKLKTQLKTVKMINPNEKYFIDYLIDNLDKNINYGEIEETRYYVNNENGFYIHKQVVKNNEVMFDSVRYHTEKTETIYLQKLLAKDPLIEREVV